MARARRSEVLKRVPLSEIKDDLSRYLRRAADAPIVVTRHGRPAGVLIGFASEEDWFDYQLESDPRFARRAAREGVRRRATRTRKWSRGESNPRPLECDSDSRSVTVEKLLTNTRKIVVLDIFD
jgi:prevent-host-death family protein